MTDTINEFAVNRRAFLKRSAGGLGFLALGHLLALDALGNAAPVEIPNPLAPRAPHYPCRITLS